MNTDSISRVGARIGLKNRLKGVNRANVKSRIQGLKKPTGKLNQRNRNAAAAAAQVKNKDTLDMDLDEYMAKSKSRLDQDLDTYMAQANN